MNHPHTQLPTREDFSAAINSTFGVLTADRSLIEFTLVDCKSHVSDERQECYSLIFRGPADHPPVQSIYSLQSEQLGEFDLFLVPIKRDEAGLYFEAVMNHLVSR